MALTDYRPLGSSGLIVSPLTLGTMTFGADRWGVEADGAAALLDHYLEAGGNTVDTAEAYAGGRSEEMLGALIAERGIRDDVVLATKYTWNDRPGNPNAGGSGRKNVLRAVEGSLRRLGTDWIDLYWMHFWDEVTPIDEVLTTLSDLVRSGRIRYYGLSNVPAWYLTRMATMAAERGLTGPIALQTHYSLVERSAEWEHLPAARELGVGVVPWSPLAGGFLSGKYQRDGSTVRGDGRLAGANPLGQTPFTDRNWDILDAVRQTGQALDRTAAEVALAWTATRPGIDTVLIGATRPDQVRANIAALTLDLPERLRDSLDAASAPPDVFPWSSFGGDVHRAIFGGADVRPWRG